MADTAKIKTLRDHTTGEAVAPRTVVKALSGEGTSGQLVGYTDDNIVGNITPDAVPTEGSTNPVQSGGVYDALERKADKAELAIPSNPNLLDNWYFVGGGSQQNGGQFPINQRGQTEYTSGYGIDRWSNSRTGKVLIEPDCLSLDMSDGLTGIYLLQRIESYKDFAGKTLTASILYSYENDDARTKWQFAINDGKKSSGINLQDNNGIISLDKVTYKISDDATQPMICIVNGLASYEGYPAIKVYAVKLELGDRQTLAHKEDNKWVLNEIPNYTTELFKCQRYQFVFPGRLEKDWSEVGIGLCSNDTTVIIPIQIPAELRKNPSVSYVGNWRLVKDGNWGGGKQITKIALNKVSVTNVSIYVTSDGLTAGEARTLVSAYDSINPDVVNQIIIDANL